MNSYSYSSFFKPFIEGIIEQKRAIGYPYDSSARILRVFDKFCVRDYPDATSLTRDIATAWATLKDDEHQNGLLRRVTPVRQLAKYMNSIGVEAYVIPSKFPKKQIRYVPHIFTTHELRAFFDAVDRCERSPFGIGRHLVIPVFFRMLYCCGLRSTEARMLRCDDVDLNEGALYVRKSKGHKDRQIYMSNDLTNMCRRYDLAINSYYPVREAFFPNQKGTFYNKSTPWCWFREFWDRLPEARIYSGSLPRVHDFRHTYAVNRLNGWLNEGKDVNAYLPYLSMYLGHVNQADTDYYLHLVPEFFPALKEKAASFASLLPEVYYEETK